MTETLRRSEELRASEAELARRLAALDERLAAAELAGDKRALGQLEEERGGLEAHLRRVRAAVPLAQRQEEDAGRTRAIAALPAAVAAHERAAASLGQSTRHLEELLVDLAVTLFVWHRRASAEARAADALNACVLNSGGRPDRTDTALLLPDGRASERHRCLYDGDPGDRNGRRAVRPDEIARLAAWAWRLEEAPSERWLADQYPRAFARAVIARLKEVR